MSRRELEGSIHHGATPPHRALRNEGGWTIPTRDPPVAIVGAAPRVVGAQVAAVHHRQKDHQDRVLGAEKDGKTPSLKGWGGVAQKRAVTRIIVMESTAVFELITH